MSTIINIIPGYIALFYIPILFCLFYFCLFSFFACLCFFLFCLFIGNTLTPLTALTPVSDVGKTMLQPSSLSVLGDHQQFQAGLFVFICFCLFVCLFLFVSLFLFSFVYSFFYKSKTFHLLMCVGIDRMFFMCLVLFSSALIDLFCSLVRFRQNSKTLLRSVTSVCTFI